MNKVKFMFMLCVVALLVFIILLFSGCSDQYRPPIIDIRQEPLYIGIHPDLPDTSNFIPPVKGFDYAVAEQRRLNHLVKFQAQLRQQQLRVQ